MQNRTTTVKQIAWTEKSADIRNNPDLIL